MEENTNRAIHQFLGKCWHESAIAKRLKSETFDCAQCDKCREIFSNTDNPDYTTDLNAIREAELKVTATKEGEVAYSSALAKRIGGCRDKTEWSIVFATADAKTRTVAVLDVIEGDEK